MTDVLIPTNLFPVNDNPPTWSEANRRELIAHSLETIKRGRAWVDSVVASIEAAECVVDTIDFQGSTDELNANVVALTRALNTFAACVFGGLDRLITPTN